jgi:hypothetical protein
MTRRTFFLAGILALAASAHLAQQNPQSNGATIRGIVTREGSSEPIPDVLISLTGSGARAAAIRGGGDFGAAPPVAEGTRTDKEGRFTIAGVLQGNYNLQASLDGYFGPPTASGYARAASRFITVSRPSEEVNLSLVKGAVISGRAVDANGRPALGSAVQALRLVYRNGAPNLQSDGSGPVDDRGEYRIFQLPPGEYYICLIPSASGARGFAARGGVRGESGEISQPTYFPGTTDPLQALPLKVNPGEERTGVNLNLRTAMTVRISGQVLTNVAIPGRGGPRGDNTLPPAQLTLVPRDLTIPYNTTTRSLSSVQLTEPARGRFEINGVVPGKYDLFASVTNANAVAGALNETRYFAGRVAVDVGLQNLENVSVAVGQPLPLKIRVTVNGSSTIPPETIRVQAQPADASFSVGAYTSNSPVGLVAVDAQGELTIPSLHEALYRRHSTRRYQRVRQWSGGQ